MPSASFIACSFAMGREFLKVGDALVFCGRNEQRVEAAVDALRAEWPGSEVLRVLHASQQCLGAANNVKRGTQVTKLGCSHSCGMIEI